MTSDNAARVLHALQRTPSARRVDLMHLCHMTRGEVLEACEELMRARLIRSINGGARYAARDRVTA
jgi:DNA-binding transcriptional MocR family regulator